MRYLLLLLALLLPATAHAQIFRPDCGGLGQRRCLPTDAETYSMQDVALPFTGCEIDLLPDSVLPDATCVNNRRITGRRTSFWLTWALSQQRFGISGDEPINWVTQLGAHNAYSNLAQGFTSVVMQNHTHSITDQLNLGMRTLELDLHYYLGQYRLCHGSDTAMCFAPGNVSGRLIAYAFREIRQWLDAHPNEVLILIFDNKLEGSELAALDELFNTYFSGRAYLRSPTPLTRWPSLQELRASNKQLLVFSSVSMPNSPWAWYKPAYFPTENWPRLANPTWGLCRDADGNDMVKRSFTQWVDLNEGRSGSNLFDFTGFNNEAEVTGFSRCTASMLGLDYVDARDNALPFLEGPMPDRRVGASIWSYEENDSGLAGPASLRELNGRWRSRQAIDNLPYACALIDRTGPNFLDRAWEITRATGPWSETQGDQACKSEYGITYTFAFPSLHHHNEKLLEKMRLKGVTDVWLRYVPKSLSSSGVDRPVLNFFSTGSLPPAQTLTIFNLPNTEFDIELAGQLGWLSVSPTRGRFDAEGKATLTFTITSVPAAPSRLGITAQVFVRYGSQRLLGHPITTNLTVVHPTTTTITSSKNPANVGETVLFTVRVSSTGAAPSGRLRLARQVIDGVGRSSLSTFADLEVPGTVNPATFLVPFTVADSGDRIIEANFIDTPTLEFGDAGPKLTHGNSTAQLTQRGNSRMNASPSVLEFTWEKGVLGTGASKTSTVTSPAGGLRFTILSLFPFFDVTAGANGVYTFKLNPNQIANMPVGDAVATVVFQDAINDNQALPVIVRLKVTAPLTVSPGSMNFVVSTTQGATQSGNVTAPSQIGLEFKASHDWITAAPALNLTDTPFAVAVTPKGLTPGTYNGQVTVFSPSATVERKVNITMTVVAPTTFTTNDGNRTIVIDGQTYTMPVSFNWLRDTQHTVSVPLQQLDGAGTRFNFVRFTDGGASTRTITARADGGTFTVEFQKQFQLNAQAVPANGGDLTIAPPSADGFYNSGTQVSVQAVPRSGFSFTGFSGSLSGKSPSGTVPMTAPRSLTAAFSSIPPITVTISSNVAGGRVIIDGVEEATPVQRLWVPGETHQISAPLVVSQGIASRLAFLNWSNAQPQTFTFTTPSSDASLEARFALEHLVTANANPAAGGTVTGGGWIRSGQSATIQATPAQGFTFSNFSGAITGPANPQNVVVNGPLNVVANFASVGSPRLYATTGGPRVDVPNGLRSVPLRIMNAGPGFATDAQITNIRDIRVMSGSGAVSIMSAFPIPLGGIAVNQGVDAAVLFTWPATAVRVQFTVDMVSGGGITTSTTLTLIR